MALSKGVNSYATVAEANAYFDDHINSGGWSALDDLTKSRALITASSLINDQKWTGSAISDSQTLAFPRYGSYIDPALGYEIYFDDTGWPTRVSKAVFELSLHLANNTDVLSSDGQVKSIDIGTVSLQQISNAPIIPGYITSMIRPLLSDSGRSWWRAN